MYLVFILALIFGLLGVLIWNVNQFVSPKLLFDVPPGFIVDAGPTPEYANAAEVFSTALSFKTTTNVDPNEFSRMKEFLKESFPLVHENCEITEFDLGIAYKWKGSDESLDKEPIVLMSHMDTVPVPEANMKKWTHGPWSGDIAEDGFIYGRGAIDTKGSLTSSMNAVEELLKTDFIPKRTVYLCYGFDEEIVELEYGAKNISSFLEKQGVRPYFVLDEGGFVVRNVFDKLGIEGDVAMIGVAEKQYLGVTLEVNCGGGHGSLPPKRTCIYQMSQAIQRIIDNPMKAHASSSLFVNFLEHVFPNAKILFRIVFSLFRTFPFLADLALSNDKKMNGMIRTTFAPTIFNSGETDNVLPKSSKVMLNIRVHPEDTMDEAVEHIKKVIKNDNIKVEVVKREGYQDISDYQSVQYETIVRSIKSVFKEVNVYAPNLVYGTTDMKHYRKIAPNTAFNFSPVILDQETEDVERIHGVDERISKENYYQMIHFFVTLIKNLQIVS